MIFLWNIEFNQIWCLEFIYYYQEFRNLQKIVGNALLFGYFHYHHNGAVLDGEIFQIVKS